MEHIKKHYSEKRAKEFANLMKKQGMTNIRIINEFDGFRQPIYTVVFNSDATTYIK